MYGKMKQHLCDSLAGLKDAGLYKEERIIEGPQQAEILVKGKKSTKFSVLTTIFGLSNHPRLIEGAKSYDGQAWFWYVFSTFYLWNTRYP